MPAPNEPTPDPGRDALLDALLPDAGWVLALAKRLARDQATAEDIAQSTLALALERRPAVDGGLRPWLAKVAARLSLHSVRSDARRRAREALAASVRDASASAGGDEVLERFELQQELAQRVGALPEPYRNILIRHYYEGLSVKEIAAVTGSSSGTVRSQLSRGLERLRLVYTDDSSGRSALGAFLFAAGFPSDFAARRTAELLVMQTSTKVLGGAAVLLAASVFFFVVDLGAPETPPLEREGTFVLSEEHALAPSEPNSVVDTPPDESDRAPAITVAVAAPPVEFTTEEESAPQLTTIRARILGANGNPIVGATLSSVHSDGRPRGANSVARSGYDGRVALELDDDSIRKSRREVYDMIFAASGSDHATRFVIHQPRLHGETDLGDLRLELGGALFGVCVDSEGRPIAGAVLFAGASVVTGGLQSLRIHGPQIGVNRPRAVSAADGSFELSGIPSKSAEGGPNSVRIWAHAPSHLWTITEPFAVTARARIDAGNISLEAVPRELGINGEVFRPDGLPAEGARIDFTALDAPQHGHVIADDRGRFMVVGKSDAPLEFLASDPTGNLGMSATRFAERGETVELRLRERRILSVMVVDTDGEPIEDAHLMASLADTSPELLSRGGETGGRLLPGGEWSHTNADGQVDIELPGQRFTIGARSWGSGSKNVGPFEIDSSPSELTITLPRAFQVRGQVLAHGEPVEGARVYAMRRYESFAAMTGGFPNRYPSGASSVASDEEGRFVAPLKLRWSTVGVLVRAEGFAVGEVRLDVLPSDPTRDIEIHLTEGGAIEGTVTPPPGMEAEGLYVAASRGDGLPRSTIVDGKGRYRFEGLTPGDWRVEGRLHPVVTELLSISRHPDDLKESWNATVTDGETLELDMDMRHLVDVEIYGRFLLDGDAPPLGWVVEAVLPVHARGSAELPRVELAQDGSFSLTTRPGRLDLRFLGDLPGSAKVEVLREVQASGPRFEWKGELQTAQVSETLEAGIERVRFLRGDLEQGARELTIVSVGDDGALSARIPVGESALQLPSGNTDRPWVTLRSIELR